MSNYVLLYTGSGMPANETERKKINKEWTDWFKQIDKSVVDQGYPFSPMAKNISTDGKIYDGPAGSMITGYSVIKAISMDAAIQLAKSCPAWRHGAKISVYETMNTME